MRLPERFFVLQDESRNHAQAVATAAGKKDDKALAESYGRLVETCVACQSAEEVRHIADINAMAYASPLELARESLGLPSYFQQGDCRGYVGYVEGKAVTVGTVSRVGGVAYVGSVATLAEYRQRGYGEALMRHSLEEAQRLWGMERTVLHASDAGHPLYLQMGYRDVATFGFYMALPGQ
jgi:ribosomal protein S18 acetylase RimI-like enzyme